MIYTVKAGDTIYSIAADFGISPERIIKDNGIYPPYTLSIGQALLILIPYLTHTVQEGETISSIAAKYSTTQMELFQKNYALHGNDKIFPGQTIIITYQDENKDYGILSNSYAYPFISEMRLNTVTPYLSGMVPFTYGFTENGDLVPLDDERIIAASKKYGASPFMHLSTLTPEGVFNNNLSTILLSDTQLMQKLTNEILETIRQKGYEGIDIDFEFIPAEDGIKYVQFINMVKQALTPEGYIVIVALAPKTSDTQKGLLYEGHDYGMIGNAADYVLLMTYEWGYAYSRPMAVAPINNVRRVIEYALTRIPREKIMLGIPNYGYNWTLPYIEGTTVAISLGNAEAAGLAAEYNAEIIFDEEAKTPFFNYIDRDGARHEVWFEDPRSISAKFDLVKQYGLSGIGVWNTMREFPAMWLMSAVNYKILSF